MELTHIAIAGRILAPRRLLLPDFVPVRDPNDLAVQALVWYPVNRTVTSTSVDLAERQNYEHPLATYLNSMSPDLDFKRFFTWFREREDIENEHRLQQDPDHRDRQLEAVRRAISQLVPGFKGDTLRVKRTPQNQLLIVKGDTTFSIDQLSDGEKCLIALIGDLARRLAIADPFIADPLEATGIVLLDEIELHLHPAWQRAVLNHLPRTFPGCQFIITTHSPTVLTEVPPDRLLLLTPTETDGIQVRRPEAAYGMDVTRALEDLMGVPGRPSAIEEELKQLAAVLGAQPPDFTAARLLLDDLEARLGGDDPTLVRSRAYLQTRELLKR